MNSVPKFIMPPWVTLLAGVPAVACLYLLYTTGIDDRGLFISGHPAAVAILALTAVLAIWLAVVLIPHSAVPPYRLLFPRSPAAVLGTALGALGLTAAGIRCALEGTMPMDTFFGGAMVLGGAALAVLAWLRRESRKANVLLWAAVTVSLMLRLLVSYRQWSGQPQLMDYLYPLLSSVALTLAMFYRAGFSGELESPRLYLFFSQLGGFCALLAIPHEPLFYAGMAAWALTDVCSLRRTLPQNAVPREDEP